ELRAIPPAYAVERVAAAVVAAARRPRRQKTVGVASHLMLLSHRFAPATTEAIVGPAAARLLVRRSTRRGDEPQQPADGRVGGDWRLGGARRALGARVGRWRADRVP